MKKLLTKIAIAVAGITGVASAQQDPQFTQFMFNKLIYNAGYAGTSGAYCGVLQYRKQWLGFNGAPTTMAFSGDMRLSALPIGVGITFMSDKIGPMSTTYFRAAGSYNITKIAGGTLGLGLDLGIINKSISGDWITPEGLKFDPSVPGPHGTVPGVPGAAYSNPALNKTVLDLGFGAFYQIPGKFYAGLSSTHLPAQDIKGPGSIGFQVSRHYYMMAGYTFQPTKWSKITPNVLYKSDARSSSLDLNLTFLWSDMVWVGGTYRMDDAPAVMLGYQGEAMTGNALKYKIGFSYDMPNPNLKVYAKGTGELIIGVCYTPKIKMPTSFGNDRFLD